MSRTNILRAAHEGFGYPALRAGQEEAIRALSERRDVLAVMPTGWGKSAIYQVSGLLMDGPTVVVSPLISLQHDQVETILEEGTGGAVVANSTVAESVRRTALERVGAGAVEFLFLAPEQFAREETMAAVRASRPSLFVVDEAHCISAWGHDFRPAYLHLDAVIDALGHPPVLALTATATAPVREEIAARLGLNDPLVLVRGFDRPNIRLTVERFQDERSKIDALVERAASLPRPGIVYTATRAGTEQLASALEQRGLFARPYHAGLPARVRRETQDRFMDGTLEVVAATTAFGLGIDKPDVRFVLHAEPSESLDAYYQEVGRGGRDGDDAEATLFYRPEDLGVRRYFAGGPRLAPADLEAIARLVERLGPLTLDEMSQATRMRRGRVATAVGWLAREGAVEVGPGGEPISAGERKPGAAVNAAMKASEARKRLDQSRVEMMRGYAEARTCRRRFLLNYLGEEFEPPCSGCDNCEQRPLRKDSDGGSAAAEAEGEFETGAQVTHPTFGPGTVMGTADDTIVVLFDDEGYKTLSLEAVKEGNLLEVK